MDDIQTYLESVEDAVNVKAYVESIADSISEENSIMAMLPQVRPGDEVVSRSEVDDDTNDTLGYPTRGVTHNDVTDMITDTDREIDSTYKLPEEIMYYINHPENEMGELTSEGVVDTLREIPGKVKFNFKTEKLLIELAIMKARLKVAKKRHLTEKQIKDLQHDIVRMTQKLNSIKKSMSSKERNELSKREKEILIKLNQSLKMRKSEFAGISLQDAMDDITESFHPIQSAKRIIHNKDDKIEDVNPSTPDFYRGRIEDIKKEIIDLNKEVSLAETPEKKEELKARIKDLTAKMNETIGKLEKATAIAEERDKINEYKDKRREAIEQYKTTGKESYKVKVQGLNYLIDKSTENIKNMTESARAVIEKANMEDEIKPIVDKLNKKGYKVKYASPGHNKLRKKEDKEPDGVYYGHLYSDARIMFKENYNFETAPDGWHWRLVDNCSYLDITPKVYNAKKDGTPDEAFAKWKAEYMKSLSDYVDQLEAKDDLVANPDENVEESVFNDEVDDTIDVMTESLVDDYLDDLLNISESTHSSDDSLNEIDELFK